jgi:hypothetical protein
MFIPFAHAQPTPAERPAATTATAPLSDLTLEQGLECLARDHGAAVEARVVVLVTVDGDFLLESYEVEVRVRPHHSWQVFAVTHDSRRVRALVRSFAQRQAQRQASAASNPTATKAGLRRSAG